MPHRLRITWCGGLNQVYIHAMTHIHFVCTGNIYRSRVAEAYLKSRKIPNVTVSSSGTAAKIQHKGSITWYGQRLLFRHNLIPFMKKTWNQTNKELLNKADVVIFLGKKNHEFCAREFDFQGKHEIWDLPDFDDVYLNGQPLDIKKEIEYIEITENVFSQIKIRSDKLILKFISQQSFR